MSGVQLVVGLGECQRIIDDSVELLSKYQTDIGYDYYSYAPATPDDVLLPEDLAVTLLVNSQTGWRAFRSLQRRGGEIDLTGLPRIALEIAGATERCMTRDGALAQPNLTQITYAMIVSFPQHLPLVRPQISM